MKTWNSPVIEELSLNQTEANRNANPMVGFLAISSDVNFNLPSGKEEPPEILA